MSSSNKNNDPQEFLRQWAPRLRFFRYVKALGGHVDNGIDELVLALRYSGENDLTRLLDELNIPYTRFLTKPPQPEVEKSYSSAESENSMKLEGVFEKYSKRVIDPPVDWANCICPKYYPHYWEAV